jgi:hypothetical protein
LVSFVQRITKHIFVTLFPTAEQSFSQSRIKKRFETDRFPLNRAPRVQTPTAADIQLGMTVAMTRGKVLKVYGSSGQSPGALSTQLCKGAAPPSPCRTLWDYSPKRAKQVPWAQKHQTQWKTGTIH